MITLKFDNLSESNWSTLMNECKGYNRDSPEWNETLGELSERKTINSKSYKYSQNKEYKSIMEEVKCSEDNDFNNFLIDVEIMKKFRLEAVKYAIEKEKEILDQKIKVLEKNIFTPDAKKNVKMDTKEED